ncbi:MAG: hypothetical protein JO205_04010 [Pseudolabrys sp.]|nr:hypothetical protein [Pseudolabrys sp.]
MQPQALQQEPTEADYDAFCATVMATARGRWFLAEYARRHRKADTDAVLAALHKIEDMVRGKSEPALARLRDEVRALGALVREASHDLGTSGGAVSNAARVMALLDLLTERIDYVLAPGDDRAPLTPPDVPAEPKAERAHLAVVVETPAPASPPPTLMNFPSAALLPALNPSDAGPNVVAINRTPAPRPAPAKSIPSVVKLEAAKPAAKPQPSRDPFADIMALTEAERIALFT